YTESFPLARRYREQPVMALWEGSGNVVALDALRALARAPESIAAFESEIWTAAGEHPLLDAHLVATRRLLREAAVADADAAAWAARRLVEHLALALQGSLLVRTAPPAVSDAFMASRLGESRGHLYGLLPAGTDVTAILSRHGAMPLLLPGRRFVVLDEAPVNVLAELALHDRVVDARGAVDEVERGVESLLGQPHLRRVRALVG